MDKPTKIIRYRYSDGILIDFIPVKDLPGYTHQVMATRGYPAQLIGKFWFSASVKKLSVAVAKFYYDQAIAKLQNVKVA